MLLEEIQKFKQNYDEVWDQLKEREKLISEQWLKEDPKGYVSKIEILPKALY